MSCATSCGARVHRGWRGTAPCGLLPTTAPHRWPKQHMKDSHAAATCLLRKESISSGGAGAGLLGLNTGGTARKAGQALGQAGGRARRRAAGGGRRPVRMPRGSPQPGKCYLSPEKLTHKDDAGGQLVGQAKQRPVGREQGWGGMHTRDRLESRLRCKGCCCRALFTESASNTKLQCFPASHAYLTRRSPSPNHLLVLQGVRRDGVRPWQRGVITQDD